MMNQDMPSLYTINNKYRSDKGFGHNYIEFYDSLFEPLREEPLHLLEIGVLFGSSLKLWHDYFINAQIYGIDDFSQTNGHQYYNFQPIRPDEIKKDLASFKNITLLNFDCTNQQDIVKYLHNLKFDIIIDDANHDLVQQQENYTNYHSFLNDGGVYICEDVSDPTIARHLISHFQKITPSKTVSLHEFNVHTRLDDRLVVVR